MNPEYYGGPQQGYPSAGPAPPSHGPPHGYQGQYPQGSHPDDDMNIIIKTFDTKPSIDVAREAQPAPQVGHYYVCFVVVFFWWGWGVGALLKKHLIQKRALMSLLFLFCFFVVFFFH